MKSPRDPSTAGPTAAKVAHWFVIGLLLVIGVALRIQSLPVHNRTPDEKAYTFYAQTLEQGGVGELPRLVREYLEEPKAHLYPPPTRLGYVGIVAVFMRLKGSASAETAALVSMLASVLMLILLVLVAVTFFDLRIAAVALLFAVVSPMDLAMARRAWCDELLSLAALGLVHLFLRQTAAPRRARRAAGFLALAAGSILIKETGLLLLAIGTVGLALLARRPLGLRGSWLALAGGVLALGAGIAALALACGGTGPLFQVVTAMNAAAASNPYVLQYQTGGPGYYARGLALLQPIPMTLGLAGALLTALGTLVKPLARGLKGKLVEPRAPVVLAWFVIAFTAAALAFPQKNLRFLGPIYPALDLLAGVLLVGTLEAIGRRVSPRALRQAVVAGCAVLALAALADQRRLADHFVQRAIPDLATPRLTPPPD